MDNASSREVDDSRPAKRTIGAILLVLALYVLITRASGIDGEGTRKDFVESDGFRAWAFVAAMSVALWLNRLSAGVRTVRAYGHTRLRRQVGWYLVFVVLVAALLIAVQEGGSRPDIPLAWWRWGSYIFPFLGAAAAGPWVILIWLLHSDLQTGGLGRRPESLIPKWESIEASLLALLVIVLSATLTTAAMRVAVTAKGTDGVSFVAQEAWPSARVLLFGAFYTILLAFAFVPLLLTWRQAARASLVGSAPSTPQSESPERDDVLERALHVDHPYIRTPLTGLAVFSPLITALLAYYIPEIASN